MDNIYICFNLKVGVMCVNITFAANQVFLIPNFICNLHKYNQQIVEMHITYTEARRRVLCSSPL
jgi:hypothetical protein